MTNPVRATEIPIAVTVEAGKDYWWCSCGLSKTQPFCDGSHSGSTFTPVKYSATESKPVYFCGCKASAKQPLCDGSHRNPVAAPAIYDIALQDANGQATTLAAYKGNVLLIVNVASKCGLTPQYAGLEKLNQEWAGSGLQVLGFPCNDFAAQEPGSSAEIAEFCQLNYGVSFPVLAKISINSAPRHDLYRHLIAAQPQAISCGNDNLREKLGKLGLLPKLESDLMWNFEKFLVGRKGQVLARFAPDVAPDDAALLAAIQAALTDHS